MNLYLSIFDYLRATTGLETGSLVGNTARLSGAQVAGATSLSITPATTVALAANDRITIFDGPNSEVVVAASTTAIGQTSVPIQSPGLVYDHAGNTPLCSDGVMGSLADQIVDACGEMENFLQQSLFQATYTETLRMPSMRASVDNQQMLVFRPRHFPVTLESGITIKQNNANPVSYDASQAILDVGKQVVSVPWLTAGSGGGSTYSLLQSVSRSTNLFLTITYTSGYPAASMPGDIREAAILLTSDYLAKRFNPAGFDEIDSGQRRTVVSSRGDTSGDSLLYKRAARILNAYAANTF